MTQHHLQKDLAVLAAMAGEMDDYLKSDVLFWNMMAATMPKLTLGGYLMRQHRLLALADQLNDEEQQRLQTAVSQYEAALVEKIVRLETRAHRELDARLRQWQEYLHDLTRDKGAAIAGYRSAVDTRAMISALIAQLKTPPYRLQPRITAKVDLLDKNLRSRWQPEGFIWPENWQPAYPELNYWWLYGTPL